VKCFRPRPRSWAKAWERTVGRLITDGRFSGGSHGFVVGTSRPRVCRRAVSHRKERRSESPLTPRKESLSLDLSAQEIKRRLQKCRKPKARYTRGVLAKYAKLVNSAHLGAVPPPLPCEKLYWMFPSWTGCRVLSIYSLLRRQWLKVQPAKLERDLCRRWKKDDAADRGKEEGNKESKETFTLFAPEAQSVELAGNFTNWENNPIPLKNRRTARGNHGPHSKAAPTSTASKWTASGGMIPDCRSAAPIPTGKKTASARSPKPRPPD